MNIGENIRRERELRRYSRPELCKKLNIKTGTLVKYEKGLINISAARCKEIADALKMDVRDLFKD